MIKVINKGSFKNTKKFLKDSPKNTEKIFNIMKKYGEMGVNMLKEHTPVDTGKTANSWRYEIVVENGKATLIFHNDNMTKMDIPVAILIEYGHATRNGGWIQGKHYIDSALEPVFEKMANDAWEEVTK